jgi:hypothetical protein
MYAVSGAVFYLVCFLVFSNLAGLRLQDYRLLLKSGFNFVALWVLLGLLARYALGRFV